MGASIEALFRAQADRRAPDDEARDMNRELWQDFQSGLTRSDFVGNDEMTEWLATLRDQDSTLAKAVVLNSAWYSRGVVNRGPVGHKAILYVNELGISGAGPIERWDEKPLYGGLPFLKYMGFNLDLHQAVVHVRDKQVKPFTRRYRDNDQNPLGYEWVRADGEDTSNGDKQEIERLDKILQNCGTEFDPLVRRFDLRRRTFSAFISALLADTLTADACPIETERSNDGRVIGWYNLPFDTIRLAREHGYQGDDSIVAVQVVEHQPMVGFTKEEILYEVRNPRSSLEYHDYGVSELEHFIRAATSYINTCTFNASMLDRNSLPRGFLTLYGRFNRRALNFFQQQWNALMRGAAKRWGMPVLVAESKNEGGAAWTPVDSSNAEMLMSKWLIFIVSLYAALHGMAPEELNMESFSAKTSGLGAKADTAERLQSAHDKGLVSILKWVFDDVVNPYLVGSLTKKYKLTLIGLYPDDQDQKHERSKLTLTIDEMRSVDGVEPMDDPDLGEAPANPALMSIYMQKKQQEMMQAMGGMGGQQGFDSGLPGSEAPHGYDDGEAKEENPWAAGNGNGNENGNGGGFAKPGGAFPAGAPKGVQPNKPASAGAPFTKARIPGKLRVEIRELPGRLVYEDQP